MNEKKTVAGAIDTLTEKPIQVKVDVFPQSRFHKILMRFNLKPRQYDFQLRPITVANMARIAAMAEQLPDDLLTGTQDEVQAQLMKIAASDMEKLVYIVGAGLQNNRYEPKEELLATIRYEFTASDLVRVLAPIWQQLNLADFMRSIVSVKGMRILRNPDTSPQK